MKDIKHTCTEGCKIDQTDFIDWTLLVFKPHGGRKSIIIHKPSVQIRKASPHHGIAEKAKMT